MERHGTSHRFVTARHCLMIIAVFLLALPRPGTAQPQNGDRDKPLENSDLVAMKRAGIGEGVILAAIQHAPGERLDGGAEALQALRSAGLGESVLSAVTGRVGSRSAPASAGSPVIHAKTAAEVKLFFTEKPDGAFRELGRVSAGKYGTLGRSRKREQIDDELKTKALGLGGDAVINITEDFASVSGVVIAFQDK